MKYQMCGWIVFVLCICLAGCAMPPPSPTISPAERANIPMVADKSRSDAASASSPKSPTTESISPPSAVVTEKEEPASAREAFRGLKWGDSLKNNPDMVISSNLDENAVTYSRKSDKLSIGAATVKRIVYYAWQDRLHLVVISSEGATNWRPLKQATVQKFGRPRQLNEYIDEYYWRKPETIIILKYNEYSEEATLTIGSERIQEEINSYNKAKAAQGAKEDF